MAKMVATHKFKRRIAAVQMNSGPLVSENLRTVDRLVRDCASNGATIVVLPENVSYIGENELGKLLIAEDLSIGPIQNFFKKLAKELNIWLVGGTIPLKSIDKHRVHAVCLVWDNLGQIVARYDKIHLFDVTVRLPNANSTKKSSNLSANADVDVDVNAKTNANTKAHSKLIENSNHREPHNSLEYAESNTIFPGENVVSLNSPLGKLGLSVCYDLRFPELYRKLLSEGTEIILVPSAFTAVTGEAHWHSLLRARAIENLSYVVAANQVGIHANGRASFGHSMIIDPFGKILAELPEGEGIIYADIDLDYLAELRASFPALQHRKIF